MQVTIIGKAIVERIIRNIFIEGRRSRFPKRDVRIIFPPSLSNAVGRCARAVPTGSRQRTLVAVVLAAAVLSVGRGTVAAFQLAQDAPPATQSAPLAAAALQQLVAPIALYPDALVAQILAASTYPSEIVEADRWRQQHSKLEDEKLAKEVDKQSWDPSIKALTTFPSVLANLDTNLSWTSALGDAYFNQQQDVLDAVQVLRTRARDAGNLQSTEEETVTNQGPTIIIQPANPDVCYLPSYNPSLVYGAPIGIYPGYLYDGLIGGPYTYSFGLGIGIGGGFWDGFGWGWNAWGFNWGGHRVIFNHNDYVSNSRTFFHRSGGGGLGGLGRGQDRPSFQGNHRPGDFGGNRDGAFSNRLPDRSGRQSPLSNFGNERSGTLRTPDNLQNRGDMRGFGQPGSGTGLRSGAFSGFDPGGIERGSASRGQSSLGGRGSFGGGRSFGGGGGSRGGGGGGRGGGGGHH